MLEYHRQPEATAQTLVDGWIRTGDGGYQDDGDFVFVCDRLKDMLICAGENVFPAKIERVMRTHPDVADAAVIGVPDELWGEVGLAFVVARAGARLTPRDVLRHACTRLASVEVPHGVELVSELPRTPSGKVQKGKLREAFWRGRERQVN
jgi:acyl-CoA synthetase (AMP-forming)/AMP-acid ligase II